MNATGCLASITRTISFQVIGCGSIVKNPISTGNEDFIVTPNPSDGSSLSLKIEDEKWINASLIVTDTNNKNIYQTKIRDYNNRIDLLNVPSGLYFLTLRTANFVTTKKIIIH